MKKEVIFFYLGFLSRPFTNHRIAWEGLELGTLGFLVQAANHLSYAPSTHGENNFHPDMKLIPKMKQ